MPKITGKFELDHPLRGQQMQVGRIKMIRSGIRQGSVLSPFLFAVYVDDIGKLQDSRVGKFTVLYMLMTFYYWHHQLQHCKSYSRRVSTKLMLLICRLTLKSLVVYL